MDTFYTDVDKKAYFRIEFLEKATGQRHEHVDFKFSLLDADSNTVFERAVTHSSLGPTTR